MMKLAWLSVAVIPAITSFSSSAQTLAERPELLQGESWVFRSTNQTPGWALVYRHDMQSKNGNVYLLAGDATEGSRSFRVSARRSLDLNRLLTVVGGQETDSGWFSFPLAVGKTWDAKERWRDNTGYNEITYKVIGREHITVPSGTFDAIKIEGVGFWHNETASSWATGRDDKIVATLWYAPEVKNFVRWREEYWFKGNIDHHATTDLVAARIKNGDGSVDFGSIDPPTIARVAPSPPADSIRKPGPGVPSELAAFSGRWTGSWGGQLDSTLIVVEIDGRTAKLVYIWGNAPQWGVSPGSQRVSGVFGDDNVLRASLSERTSVSYRMTASGKLDGRWDSAGRSGASGLFERADR